MRWIKDLHQQFTDLTSKKQDSLGTGSDGQYLGSNGTWQSLPPLPSTVVQTTTPGVLPPVDGSNITNLTLPADVTRQGNTFNGNSQLVQTDASGSLPAVDGSALTGILREPPIAAGAITQYWRGDKTWAEFPTIPESDTKTYVERLTLDRTIADTQDATVECGYFTISPNDALSFDVVVQDMEESNSFAGWFRVECYAYDTAGEWQIVPARGYKGIAASQEYAVEVKINTTTCYVRIRKLTA
jgi:hypothetical protein